MGLPVRKVRRSKGSTGGGAGGQSLEGMIGQGGMVRRLGSRLTWRREVELDADGARAGDIPDLGVNGHRVDGREEARPKREIQHGQRLI